MSGLILCRGKVAVNPYYIGNTDVNIYSLEELCYYIYNNIYLIGLDFVGDKLVDFIRNETKDESLADRLLLLKNKRAGLAEQVVTILKYVDYYNDEEIEEIREVLETLNTQNIQERLFLRAESLLNNRKYNSAIKNYQQITEAKRDKTLPGAFYSKVYHNMGVAYAKLFLYKQAAEAFHSAYLIGFHEESKRCELAAQKLAGESYGKISAIGQENEEETEYVIEKELETLMDNAIYSDEYKKMNELDKLKSDNNYSEYYSLIDKTIAGWKKDYTHFTS